MSSLPNRLVTKTECPVASIFNHFNTESCRMSVKYIGVTNCSTGNDHFIISNGSFEYIFLCIDFFSAQHKSGAIKDVLPYKTLVFGLIHSAVDCSKTCIFTSNNIFP